MTILDQRTRPAAAAPAPGSPRRFLMCRPTYFDVVYRINPWMDPAVAVDRDRALSQWTAVRETYEHLGHTVELIEPQPGLPDMVFAANGGFVVGDTALVARFRHGERRPETARFRQWFVERGYADVRVATALNEGEGDLLLADDVILAGTGWRSSRRARQEVAARFARPVVGLHLVDPRFYHLDTALAMLGGGRVAYYPEAFRADSRALLERRFPDAVTVGAADACAFGLNVTSDGHNVVVPAGASGVIRRLAGEGFAVHPVDVSELIKAGGAVKCTTLELHP